MQLSYKSYNFSLEELLRVGLDLNVRQPQSNPVPCRETEVILKSNNKNQYAQVVFGARLKETFWQENSQV